MLWRQKWRCRLSAILLAMTYWCILFVLARKMEEDPSGAWPAAFACLAVLSFAYVLLWAYRVGTRQEQRPGRESP